MDIQILEENSKGAAIFKVEDRQLAEMTYSIAGPELIIIDHTDVDESLKGQGIGRRLLMKIVDKARIENFKIMPLCPYAKSVFDKDESIRDVLK